MLNHINDFIKGFISRSGSYVFMAMLLSKVLSFVTAWLVLQIITEQKLGVVLYAYSFIIFLTPIAGLGLNQGYLRFGAVTKNKDLKSNLFTYTLKYGFFISILFIIGLLCLSFVLFPDQPNTRPYFRILSTGLIGFYILDLFKNYFRLNHQNRLFAYLEVTYNIVLLSLVVILSSLFKSIGYCFAIALAPILASILFLPFIKINIKQYIKPKFVTQKFWRYGFYTALAGVTTQLLYAIDMILLGGLLKHPEQVTYFKYISLIPYSLLFIPSMFITADFVSLTENFKQKSVITRYIKNYQFFFIIISFGVLITTLLFSKMILSLFTQELTNYILTFRILMFGIVGFLIFRGLFGNLLSAIGKAYLNFWIAIISLTLNIILNFIFIPKYGLNGAAMTSASIMWISGLLSFVLFNIYFKKLTSN